MKVVTSEIELKPNQNSITISFNCKKAMELFIW